jgi:hypothetical protein
MALSGDATPADAGLLDIEILAKRHNTQLQALYRAEWWSADRTRIQRYRDTMSVTVFVPHPAHERTRRFVVMRQKGPTRLRRLKSNGACVFATGVSCATNLPRAG